jgi:hypothetical protein
MCFYVCSHGGENFHFGFTPTRACRWVTAYFKKEHADVFFMSPALKTENACSSKRRDCAVYLLFLIAEARFHFQDSLCVIFGGKYFGATNFTPISGSAPPFLRYHRSAESYPLSFTSSAA